MIKSPFQVSCYLKKECGISSACFRASIHTHPQQNDNSMVTLEKEDTGLRDMLPL